MTMRRTKVVGFVGVLASTAIIVVGVEKNGLDDWRNAVSTNDFRKTLTSIKSLQEDWPAVHSIKHKVNKDSEKALIQTGYRNIAKIFLRGLEYYEKTLREMPPEVFCEGANTLLDVRSRFMKHPSYVNYFLVDSINCIIYVNLGERLIKAEGVPTCYDKIVERLAEFRCGWSLFYELANGEYDAKQMSRAEIDALSIEDKVNAIGNMVGQKQTFFIFPQDMHNLFGLRILEKRSLTALMTRLAMTDHIIGAYLPSVLSYRRKAPHFTLTDSWGQIRSVFGDEPHLPATLWDAQPRAASATRDFLEYVRSENWRQRLGFSDPPNFTKEFIEGQEREEAEREAKREAEQK